MARQYVRLTEEVTWGTFDGSATNILYIDLDTDNAFGVRAAPIRWEIRTAGLGNRRKQTGSAKTSVAGAIKTLVFGSQQAVLMPWLTSSDGTAQLKSFTADHAYLLSDGSTIGYRRYLGCRVKTATFTASEQDQLMRLNMDIIGMQPATITVSDFAEPAASSYPTDAPYVLEHGSGGLKVTSSRTGFETFNVKVENMLDARFFESQYLQYLFYCGRNVSCDSRLAYKIVTDRTKLEALTALDLECLFTNGGHTLKFEFNTKNYFDTIEDDLSLDKVFTQNLSMVNYVDSAVGSEPKDFALTVT